MARFSFPNICSHCAENHPETEWSISRSERSGNWDTTYSIGVPVCSPCSSSLKARTAASWVGAFFLGLLVFAGVVLFGLSLLAGGVAGFLTLLFGGLIIGWMAGLHFASIGSGGSTLHFSNRKYQAAFNRMNLTNLTY